MHFLFDSSHLLEQQSEFLLQDPANLSVHGGRTKGGDAERSFPWDDADP